MRYWEDRFRLLNMPMFWQGEAWSEELIAFSVTAIALQTLQNLNECFSVFQLNWQKFIIELIDVLQSIITQNFLPDVFYESYQKFSKIMESLTEFQVYEEVELAISYRRSNQEQFRVNLPEKLLTLLKSLNVAMDEFHSGLRWSIEQEVPSQLDAEVNRFFQLKNGRGSSSVETIKNPH